MEHDISLPVTLEILFVQLLKDLVIFVIFIAKIPKRGKCDRHEGV